QTQVVDSILELTNSFNTHSESKTSVFIAVDIKILQHFWMHHAASQYFYPSGMLTHIATNTSANEATDIHFSTRFSKRKIRRTETNLYILTKHFLYEKIKCLLQIGEGNIFINIQSFCLMKKAMRPCTDSFIPVNTTGTNNPDWWFLF